MRPKSGVPGEKIRHHGPGPAPAAPDAGGLYAGGGQFPAPRPGPGGHGDGAGLVRPAGPASGLGTADGGQRQVAADGQHPPGALVRPRLRLVLPALELRGAAGAAVPQSTKRSLPYVPKHADPQENLPL